MLGVRRAREQLAYLGHVRGKLMNILSCLQVTVYTVLENKSRKEEE